jgi:ureidoacrylate peracid hydrolase
MNVIIEAEPEPVEIEASQTAVLVIDMQNAFVRQGGYFDMIGHNITATGRIISPCQKIINTARQKGVKIVYLQMGYSPEWMDTIEQYSPARYKSKVLSLIRQHPEFKDKLPIQGTWGATIIEELMPQLDDIVVMKQKHDGFIGTELDNILRSNNLRYLIFIGTATNICVESTLRHAFSLDYFAILIADAVSQAGSSSNQEATIFNVRSAFGWVTTSEMLLKAMETIRNP